MLQRALDAHVTEIYMPNIDLSSLQTMFEIEKDHPWCHSLLGLHPCHVFQDYKEVLQEMEQWFAKRTFKGIGEAGLDYYWDKTFVQEQKEALRIQCGWAKQHQIPIVLHTRDALQDTLEIIQEQQDGTLRGIFHCFSGTVEEAQAVIDLNFLLGIGGVSTFKNGGLGPVLEAVDLKHVVLETDSPYLAPVPKRGKRNEPAYLPYIAARISEIKSCTLDEVAAVTSANAKNLFA